MMGLERCPQCQHPTKVYRDSGNREHYPGCSLDRTHIPASELKKGDVIYLRDGSTIIVQFMYRSFNGHVSFVDDLGLRREFLESTNLKVTGRVNDRI